MRDIQLKTNWQLGVFLGTHLLLTRGVDTLTGFVLACADDGATKYILSLKEANLSQDGFLIVVYTLVF